MTNALCPSCDAQIEIGAMPVCGMRLECPACDAALKIIWLDPVELDWWDYEDDADETDDRFPEEEEDETNYFAKMGRFSVVSGVDEEDLDLAIGDDGI